MGAVAACLAIVIAVGGILAPFSGGMIVSAYAYGTNEEITAAGAVMNSGTISESGEMKGHPLMFYLSGKDIATVRFSCKNELINFVDWTEKRDEYGNAQNFTVSYGEDESEYYYLVIDWIPNSIIRELTDNENSTIATLPVEMRNDIIVMEIVFENGETAVKAITISLLDDGTFFASFDDYQISEEDTFINRPDSEAIGAAPVIEDNYKETDSNEPEQIVIPNSITFTGTIIDNVIESLVPIILVDVEENSGLSYDKVLFELTEEQKEKVTNLAVLEAAEQKIQALKEEQNSAETDTGLMSEPETEQATANVNSPSTGDQRNNTMIYIAVALSAALVVSIVVLRVRKEKK